MSQARNSLKLDSIIIKKYFNINIFFALLFLISIFALIKIPLEVMPKENVEPFLFLRVGPFDQAAPGNIESTYVTRLEGALKSISGITSFNTNISETDISTMIYFHAKTNIEVAILQTEEAATRFAEAIGKPGLKRSVSKFNPESAPIIKLSLTSSRSELLNKWVLETLKPGLENIKGVAKIEVTGIEIPFYEYELSLETLKKYHLNTYEFADRVSVKNIHNTIGPLQNGNSKIPLNSKIIEKRMEALEKQALSKTSHLSLDQIALKKTGNPSEEGTERLNGKQSIFIEIFSKEGADLFATKKELLIKLENLKEGQKELQIAHKIIFDQTDMLEDSLENVFQELYGSIIITCLVVYFFLKKFKSALVLGISIPLSLLISITLLYFMGKTLNILTLSGLILSIGLTVDNAIVIAERIEEFKSDGLNSLHASGKAALDMFFPMLIATLTSIIIFLPALFIEAGDSFTDLLKIFQLPIFTCLAASFFVSIFFVPAFYIFTHQGESIKKRETEKKKKSTQIGLQFFKFILQNNKLTFVLFFFVVFGALLLIKDIEETDIGTPKDQFFTISLKTNPEIATTKKRTEFNRLERYLLNLKKELNYDSITSSFSKYSLQNDIMIYPQTPQGPLDEEALQAIEAQIKTFIQKFPTAPGEEIIFGQSTQVNQMDNKLAFYFQGTKFNQLEKIIADLNIKIKNIPNVLNSKSFIEDKGASEYHFIINKELMLSHHLTINDIYNALRSDSVFLSVDDAIFNGKNYRMVLKIKGSKSVMTDRDLLNGYIENSLGRKISIQSIGQFIKASPQNAIQRKAGIVTSGLYVYPTTPNQNYQIGKDVQALLSTYPFPKGYGVKENTYYKKLNEMKAKSQLIIGLSIFLIFLILASLFESIMIPISILLSVPTAIIFGILGLKIFNYALDPMARLGLLILVGSAVSNAVMLIDVILHLKERGYAHIDSIVIGCSMRVSSVLMSTFSSILGILPVALGSQKIMGIPYATLGICTISGLLFSALLTLIIVPIFYDLTCRLSEWFKIIIA